MQDQIELINKVLNNDKYLVEGKINEGSYGEVFKIREKKTKKLYALKAMDIAKLQKIHKTHEAAIEILILKKMNHPGVIRLSQVIRNPTYIGLVVELCPYGDIFQLMKTINRKFELAFKKRKIMVYYLAQILETLDYLHSNNIIHRDLKPENIVLSQDLKVKVIDFGTAKILTSNLITETEIQEINRFREKSEVFQTQMIPEPRNSLVGTINYLSPEGIDMQHSNKSDIWAFGILSYKFYYNKLPYQAKDSLQILKMIKINDLPLDQKVDPEFAELFTMTINKNPQMRLTAAELKNCKIFKNVNFQIIFQAEPPISKQDLQMPMKQTQTVKQGEFLFERALEKKMVFGNFKPRYLTISKVGNRLMMAYRYIPSKAIKNQFELNMNDYALAVKGGQFQVVTSDKHYRFRVGKGQSAEGVVQQINIVIRKGYNLQ